MKNNPAIQLFRLKHMSEVPYSKWLFMTNNYLQNNFLI